MKRITWLFLLFLIPALMPGLTTKSSSKYTFNWNERFPVIADSIHHQAQAYYQSKNLFAPQGKSESNKDYIIRMLNTYSEVKHHEFDPFIPYYQRMFSSSESEVTLTGEKYELSPYDAQAQEFTIYVRFGQDTISNTIKMKMDLETSKVFWQNWNKYNKKATFITGFDGLYIPVKFHIWNADHSFDTTITPNPIMFSNYDYNTLMVPIRNFNLYLFEPYKQAEYLFNPIDLSTQYTDFHLNCRSVVSNLMVNRLIGRTSFNRSTGEYNISKWYETILPHNGHEEMLGLPKRVHFDMTKPDSIVHFKDKIEWQSRKTSGISPEGRLFIHQSQDGMYIYDFDSGKRLLKVCDGFKNDGTETFSVTYAFDPFRKLIYMASNDSMHVYD
ncbi:MAG TPA: hypothetical protein PKK33_06880, partial [Candidatus Cloacimonadota bacterium]|nr:hypothetical protein [Candidatus Cloacimonadota bacterium]